MHANTCWGFLGLAVTFGLTALELPAEYASLQPYFIKGAILCVAVSVILFSWLPCFNRACHTGRRILFREFFFAKLPLAAVRNSRPPSYNDPVAQTAIAAAGATCGWRSARRSARGCANG